MLVEEFFEMLFGVAASVAAVTRNGELGPGGFQPLLQQSNILSPQGKVHGHLRTDVAAQGLGVFHRLGPGRMLGVQHLGYGL